MIQIQEQFIRLLILIFIGLLGVVTLSLGVVLTVFTLATAFVTYYPAVWIDWAIGKVFKK